MNQSPNAQRQSNWTYRLRCPKSEFNASNENCDVDERSVRSASSLGTELNFSNRHMSPLKISSAKTQTPNARLGKRARGCLTVFFLLFFLAGSVALYATFLRPSYKMIDARDWPTVPCTILSSQVEEKDDDGTTYEAKI